MDFVGKVILDLPLEEGTSRAGNLWKKKTWVAETFCQYPNKVAMNAMNATLDILHIEVGKTYTFSIDVESREYNGRWYTDARVFRAVETQDPNGQFQAQQPMGQPQMPQGAPVAPAAPMAPAAVDPFAAGAPGGSAFDSSDDLPF